MSPLVSADKRDQYLEERRAAIIRAAVDVFGRKGFDGANVADIAQAAGIGKGTVYLYFKSKEEIFLGIMKEYSFVPRLLDMLNTDTPVEETLTNMMRQYLKYTKQHSAILRIFLQEGHRFPDVTAHVYSQVTLKGNEALAAYLQTQIDAGRIRPLTNPLLTARAIMGLLMSHLLTQEILGAKHITPVDDEEWIQEVITLIQNGIHP